ncbi:MAG TPA: TspO/MBR family protein [Longimicrobiales bacterium]|nr:TspO/MBR family protein [Longimicrobiales bacterium]
MEKDSRQDSKRRWLGLVGWLVVTFIAALVGSQFQPGAWYDGLNKPSWNPPGAVFGPVWTVLYTLMAVAAWLVWKRHGFSGATAALSVYLVHLVANAAWSWLFFGLNELGLALAEIAVLWVLILATLVLFWRHHRVAGWLLVPYLLWVSFASVLNFTLWQMN